MVVPVLMTSCQVSEKPKSRPDHRPDHDDAEREREGRGAAGPPGGGAATSVRGGRSTTDLRFGMRRMIAVRDRPRIGIGACLLGERVRYNGGEKRDIWLVETLGPRSNGSRSVRRSKLASARPRTDGAVRDPEHGIVLMTTSRRPDLTATLRALAERRVEALARPRPRRLRAQGRIAEPARSTSVGIGPGLFAGALDALGCWNSGGG